MAKREYIIVKKFAEHHLPKQKWVAFERSYFEKRFENWLFNHLCLIEKGLTPLVRQFKLKITNRKRLSIDILAKDEGGIAVIIEVKYWANQKSILQLENYLKIYPFGCRGIIIAKKFTKNFKLRNKDIKAFQII